ncbi:hypothetical protein D3C80_1874150 [compost metagenome]
MPAITKGEPTLVRMTLNEPLASMPELEVTGVTTTPASRKFAVINPIRSPRSGTPFSSASRGRSPSPSAETMASRPCSGAHFLRSSSVSGETASVSTGMKVSERPSDTTSAP